MPDSGRRLSAVPGKKERVILKGIYSSLLLGNIILACYRNSLGKQFLHFHHDFLQIGKYYQLLSTIDDIVNKLRGCLNLASGRYCFQYAHPYHDLATHGLLNLLVGLPFVLTQVVDKVGFGPVVLVTGGDVHLYVLAGLVRQLGQYLCLLPTEKTTAP